MNDKGSSRVHTRHTLTHVQCKRQSHPMTHVPFTMILWPHPPRLTLRITLSSSTSFEPFGLEGVTGVPTVGYWVGAAARQRRNGLIYHCILQQRCSNMVLVDSTDDLRRVLCESPNVTIYSCTCTA